MAVAVLFLPLIAAAYVSPGKPSGFVNDFAGILSADQKNALETKLVQFNKDTGEEVAVVTIKSLQGDTIENYAVTLFKEWGIGQKGKDNGVLLIAAMEDRQMRIEVGYGLEGALTDLQSNWIIKNQIAPAFKTNDYYSGLNTGTDSIISAVKSEATIPSDSSGNNSGGGGNLSNWFWAVFVAFFFAIRVLAFLLGRSKSWWLGGVLGAIAGIIVLIFTSILIGIISIIVLALLGFLFDYVVSKNYDKWKSGGGKGPWFFGGGGSGGGGGGFGGGGSGGGGSSGSW